MPDIPPAVTERVQHLMVAVESILRRESGGVSELALIKALQSSPWQLLDQVDFADPAELYPIHFLVFHVLYRLRDALGGQGECIDISPLSIRLRAEPTVAGSGPVADVDKLRVFYLDLRQYSLSADNISRMMDDFWSGRVGKRPGSADAEKAADTLGFGELPASFEDVKYRFRRAVMQEHPDRGGNTARVQRLNEAFGTLRRYYTRDANPLRQDNL